MKISGEVILRAFFSKNDEQLMYFDAARGVLLSEELA